ncbi:MAG: hypothetical protein KDD37_01510 [Bdellovibrionales bacterium]|nr:hypothetical protein [Bdellovibrionales bacterium]
MILLLLFLSISFSADEGKTLSYNKSPKSLFLIKKAKVESDVGEPIIPLFDRQKSAILKDERFSTNGN